MAEELNLEFHFNTKIPVKKYGCLKAPGDLLREALGEEFDPSYYTDYLEEKYSKIYSL